MSRFQTFALTFGAFLLLALLVFGSSIQHGFSTLDDPYLVVNNLAIRGPTFENLKRIFTSFDPELYIPFTLLSYQLNYLVGGLNAGIYHFTNILLHALNATLVAWVGFLLTRKKIIGLFAGVLFLLHPLNTEAVVWVAGRKDLLSTAFALLSAGFFLQSETSRRNFALSILFFLFALLSKAAVMTLPLALFVLMFARGEGMKNSLKKLSTYFGLSIVFGIIALIGKERVVGASSLLDTILMAGKSTTFYLHKLIFPTGLNPLYPFHDQITLHSVEFWVPILVVLAVSIGALVLAKKSRWPLVAWLMFILLLAPSFLNFQKGEVAFFAVDRYAYFPAIALLLLFAATVERLHAHFWRHRKIIVSIGVMLLLVLAFLSLKQTATWQSDEVMLKRSLTLYPDNVPARTSLAALYASVGDMESEMLVLKQGQAYRENIAYLLGLGSIEVRKGNTDSAQTYYEQARLLDATNPEPLFFMAVLAEQEGGFDLAKILYKQAIDLDPSYVGAMVNLGAILSDDDDYAGAEVWLKKAIEWNPNVFETQYNLGKALEMQKKNEEAFTHFSKAYELNPTDPDVMSAYAYRLYEKGEFAKAKQIVEKYLKQDSSNRTALRLLDLINTTP